MKNAIQFSIWILISILMIAFLVGCNVNEGSSGSKKKKENRIYSHRLYLNSPPWTDLEKVPQACTIPQTLEELAKVEFALRLEFEKFDADTYGIWIQPVSNTAFQEVEPQFYELSPASVGITLFWFLQEDTEVDAWLEMEDGSLSRIYTFLIEVDSDEPCMVEEEICRPVKEEEI